MPIGRTVTGKSFEYSGSLATGLTVFFKPPHKKKIPLEIINVIRQEITKRSPVLMGANRQPLVGEISSPGDSGISGQAAVIDLAWATSLFERQTEVCLEVRPSA
jgi:hypothetical protein